MKVFQSFLYLLYKKIADINQVYLKHCWLSLWLYLRMHCFKCRNIFIDPVLVQAELASGIIERRRAYTRKYRTALWDAIGMKLNAIPVI